MKNSQRSNQKIQVLLVDDHPILRKAIVNFLEGEFSGFEITESGSVLEACLLLREKEFELVITDLMLSQGDGFTLLREVNQHYPARVLVFSMLQDELVGPRCFELGARGFVSKQADAADLVKAIQRVLNGETYLSAQIQRCIIDGKKPSLWKKVTSEFGNFFLVPKSNH